jgi:imidazole glycerol-phosphate synthase subunit HisH
VIGLVDYGMGNRRSVEKALEHVGAQTVVSGDPAALRRASALVVPGVGAFPAGMSSLRELGLDELLLERAAAGIPILGICLGMQLLFDSSEELGGAAGLGLIGGRVRRLRAEGLRVPHIGWNEVRLQRPCRLTAGLPGDGRPFYHVHSFVACAERPEDVIGTCVYGEEFASIVAREAVFGVQFHPEKSSRDGLAILSAFVGLAGRVPAVSAA